MKRHFEWIVIACLIGFLMYLGQSQFHQRHFNAFLIIVISMIFLVEVVFYWIRDKG
jgi:hypothetical protein